MFGRSSGNHDWLLANASACVSCGFRLRNARNASDYVWMETGLNTVTPPCCTNVQARAHNVILQETTLIPLLSQKHRVRVYCTAAVTRMPRGGYNLGPCCWFNGHMTNGGYQAAAAAETAVLQLQATTTVEPASSYHVTQPKFYR